MTFNGSGSSDPDGTIVSYSWAFGTGATGSGITASHTYSTAGSYNAVLTLTDNQGATATKSLTITVTSGATPPAAPSNLTASVGGNRVVTLRWTDNAGNEDGFYVERAVKAKNLQFSRIATVGANATTWSAAQTAGQWVYRVQAFNTTGLSAYSNNANVRGR